MKPTKDEVDRTLNSLEEKHPRTLAKELIAERKSRVPHLPVDEIMKRRDEQLDRLLGKH